MPVCHVSILAHPERWALQDDSGGFGGSGIKGVSILAHPERWALRLGSSLRFDLPSRKVGLRAVMCRVGTSVSILAHPERWALLEPRRRNRWITCLLIMFQSSPTPKGGRYHRHIYAPRRHPVGLGFNPRPPRKVGATRHWPPRGRSQVKLRVSILAHPERWALREVFCTRCTLGQSSPTPGGRYHCGDGVMFQSSPTPKGGRYTD